MCSHALLQVCPRGPGLRFRSPDEAVRIRRQTFETNMLTYQVRKLTKQNRTLTNSRSRNRKTVHAKVKYVSLVLRCELLQWAPPCGNRMTYEMQQTYLRLLRAGEVTHWQEWRCDMFVLFDDHSDPLLMPHTPTSKWNVLANPANGRRQGDACQEALTSPAVETLSL